MYVHIYLYTCLSICLCANTSIYLCYFFSPLLSLSLCMYTYIKIYIYIHVHTYICVYICLCIYIYVCIYTYVCIYACISTCVCVRIYTNTHTHTHTYDTHVCVCTGNSIRSIWKRSGSVLKSVGCTYLHIFVYMYI